MEKKHTFPASRSKPTTLRLLSKTKSKENLRKKSPAPTPKSTETETAQPFSFREKANPQETDASKGKAAYTDNKNDDDYFFTNKGVTMRFDYMTQKGFGPDKSGDVNQDALLAADISEWGLKLFSVFDGHGTGGHLVSNFLKTELLGHFKENLLSGKRNLPFTLKSTFESLNSSLLSSSINCNLSGSTANTVLVSGKSLYCANTGDSRTVLGCLKDGKWLAKSLSVDHKPSLQREKERITKAGGNVAKERTSGPLRVWLGTTGLPGLAMTRSFGDQMGMKAGVTCEPEITEHLIESSDKFVIMATDGFWEFISNAQAVKIVSTFYEKGQLDKVCLRLINEASFCWQSDLKRRDDISVIVVYFDHKKNDVSIKEGN